MDQMNLAEVAELNFGKCVGSRPVFPDVTLPKTIFLPGAVPVMVAELFYNGSGNLRKCCVCHRNNLKNKTSFLSRLSIHRQQRKEMRWKRCFIMCLWDFSVSTSMEKHVTLFLSLKWTSKIHKNWSNDLTCNVSMRWKILKYLFYLKILYYNTIIQSLI